MRPLLHCAIFAAALGAAHLPAFAQPDTLWSMTIPYEDDVTLIRAAELNDGSYVLVGRVDGPMSADLFAARINDSQSILWSRQYGTEDDEQAMAALQADDGTIIVVGWAGANMSGRRVIIYGFNMDGDSLWSRAYAHPEGAATKGRDVIRRSNGQIAIGGYTLGDYNHSDAWLLNADQSGDTTWTRTFGGASVDVGDRLLEGEDGNLIFVGNTTSDGAGDYDFWMVKTDSLGNQLATHTYGTENTDVCYAFARNDLGECFLAGRTEEGQASHAYLVKTDPDGNQIWAYPYTTGTMYERFQGVVPRLAGDVMAVGWYGADNSTRFWITLVDSLGTLVWSWRHGHTPCGFYDVIPASSGGCLVCGWESSAIGELSGYVLRIASPGGLRGTITSFETGDPYYGVKVKPVGDWAFTYSNPVGHYYLELPTGTYDIVASHPCTDTDTTFGVEIISNQLTNLDMTVAEPLYVRTHSSVNLTVRNHVVEEYSYELINEGSGTMIFRLEARPVQPTTDWISVEPATGIVPPGESYHATISVLTDTTDDSVYDYLGFLVIHTNSCPDTVDQIPVFVSVLDAGEQPAGPPERFALHPVYPNPFNSRAQIQFDLPQRSQVLLTLFDLSGRRVTDLADGFYEPGRHTVAIDAAGLPTGLYFTRLTTPAFQATRKLMLVK